MAAHHLPVPETIQQITINSDYTVTPQGIVVSQGDQVNFTNNSSATITITWVTPVSGQSVYTNFNVAAGTTVYFTAPSYNVSGNYYVYVSGSPQTGPYGIQVGSGPMYVQVTTNAQGVPVCTPGTVVIPWGNATVGRGKLAMIAGDSNTYSVTWTTPPGDPFTPQLIAVPDGLVHTDISVVGDYTYTLTVNTPTAGGGNGGGTVKVKNM
jgi:hypothetical protein